MKYQYTVNVLFASEQERQRASSLSAWKVEPGFDIIKTMLDDAQTPKKEQHRIFITADNANATGVVEKAITHFVERFKVKAEEIIVQEIKLIGEAL